MAANAARLGNPNLWNAYRHELFKARKQRFYQGVVLVPAALTLAAIIVLSVTQPQTAAPGELLGATDAGGPYDLGRGVFAWTASPLLQALGSAYVLVLIIACGLTVANEYRWNTIKMLATRQASRSVLVAAKCLFAVSLIGVVSGVFVLSWLVLTLFIQVLVGAPLGVAAAGDGEAIGKILYYYGLLTLQTMILALLVVALTFRFKSIVGGILAYFVYTTADSQASHFGAPLSYATPADLVQSGWIRPILEALRALHPYLLTSNVDRLMMRVDQGGTPNMAVSAFITPSGAWIVLVCYAVAFTSLAMLLFARRDITD